MKKIVGMALLLVLLWSYPVLAVTVYTDAISEYQTYGDMMDGMLVTATIGATSDTATWGTTGAGKGGAFGNGWSLTESGDTFGSSWILTYPVAAPPVDAVATNGALPLMTGLLIDAWAGKTVFDLDTPSTGTPGSQRGWTFDSAFDVGYSYLDEVALTGQLPLYDLWAKLQLDFGNGFSGTMSFIADTDNIAPSAVPEPATMLLLGSGLIGLAGYARRRFRK